MTRRRRSLRDLEKRLDRLEEELATAGDQPIETVTIRHYSYTGEDTPPELARTLEIDAVTGESTEEWMWEPSDTDETAADDAADDPEESDPDE